MRMPDNMRCVVAIPVYSSNPSCDEFDSFRQCLKILGKHDVVIFTFKELDCSVYDNLANQFGLHIEKTFFDKSYFGSVKGYNKLCLSLEFYNAFCNYDYMLIYQLDAWVFSDQLDFWCGKGYDFIGAPWFYMYKKRKRYVMKEIVGNGGLSLRKISFCIDVLKRSSMLPITTWKGVYETTDAQNVNYIGVFLRLFGFKNNMKYYISGEEYNEDAVFAIQKYSYIDRGYRYPSPIEASEFAFERYPSLLFEMNNHKLPFGCHAYKKHEFDSFWSKYINK